MITEAELNFGAIARVLGCAPNLEGCCTSPAVNMWAKYKPVRHDKMVELTDTELKVTNYGLRIPMTGYGYSRRAAMWMDVVSGAEKVAWTYDKPRGVAGEPYRICDFKGYNHSCVAPISPMAAVTFETYEDECEVWYQFFIQGKDNTANNLTFADLRVEGQGIDYTFDEMWLGVCVLDDSAICKAQTLGKWKDIKKGNNEIGVPVTLETSLRADQQRSYEGVLFFSTQPLPEHSGEAVLYPIPFVTGVATVLRKSEVEKNVMVSVIAYRKVSELEQGIHTIYYKMRFFNPFERSVSVAPRVEFYNDYNNNFPDYTRQLSKVTLPALSNLDVPAVGKLTQGDYQAVNAQYIAIEWDNRQAMKVKTSIFVWNEQGEEPDFY